TYPISVAQEFDDRLYKNVFFGPSVRTSDNGSSSFRIKNDANAWIWLSLFPAEGNIIELDLKAITNSRIQARLLTGKPLMKGGGKTDFDWRAIGDEVSLKAGQTYTLQLSLPREAIMAAT
ncbi:hypothetical protein, partial [Escherichia coli]|uniref:hypothetical protein n=1 Tax=Escherichia coli TaxID=562 RepID=UPI002281F4E7